MSEKLHFSNATINFICDNLLDENINDDLEAFAHLIRLIFGENTVLHVSYRESIEIYNQTALDSLAAISGARAIYYFTCSQMSWFKSSSGTPHPFGFRFPLYIFTEACRDIFDDSFTQEVIEEKNNRINVQFGGFNPSVNFGYFVNGGFDPYRLQGITQDLNIYSFADVIPGHGKAADLASHSEFDSPEVTAVKNRIWSLIEFIINQ